MWQGYQYLPLKEEVLIECSTKNASVTVDDMIRWKMFHVVGRLKVVGSSPSDQVN